MPELTRISHLIIDMDGVLYLGDKPMPRLVDFFNFLRLQSIQFILATNNSTHTSQQYADKLAGMGVIVSPGEILVSGQATAQYLARGYPRGTRVYVFGMPALKQAMVDEGFVLAEESVKLVVASMDRNLTYEKLAQATILIRNGARFIATNLDPTQPSERGLVPGTGSIILALEAASGVKSEAVGKPEPIIYQLAMEQMNADPDTTAIIGDRVDTDILGGKRAGLMTICVLSGASDRLEAEAIGTDLIFDDIADLLDTWEKSFLTISQEAKPA